MMKIKKNTHSFLEEINQIVETTKMELNDNCEWFEKKMEKLKMEEGITDSQLKNIYKMKKNAASFKQEINDLMITIQSKHLIMEREIVYNLYKMEKEAKEGN